jgi:RND family efflux transporter MFP subunit
MTRFISPGTWAPALLALPLLAIACSKGEAARTGAGAPRAIVTTSEARLEEIPETLSLTGTLQPMSRVVLAGKVMGRIRKIGVKEGDHVRVGRVLVTIDDTDLRAGLARARAGLEAAEAGEENASRMRDRMRELEARQSASRKNREDAEMGFDVASAQRRQAEAAVASAGAMLADASIASPIDGLVASKQAEEGDMAAPGAPLLTLESTSRMKVEAALPERQGASIHEGDRVEVSFDAGVERRSATIAEILPSADPATRSFLVRVVLDNASGSLRSGTFARLEIDRGSRKALTVPKPATFERGPLTGLFVVEGAGEGAVARLRWVRTGSETGGRVEILSGLREGETYLSEPPPDLGDGAPVQAAR